MEKLLANLIYQNVVIWVIGSEEPFRGSIQDVGEGLVELSISKSTTYIALGHIVAVREILE